MNFVYISPYFPPNYVNFCAALRRAGANVLGLGDAPWEELPPELRAVLGEYYRVPDLHDYDACLRALGWFTHRHGRIDRLDSLNEYWLELEADLRTDFNIPGVKRDGIARITRKSRMKKVFAQAGIATAPGEVIQDPAHALAFAARVGYPVVVKPDRGVGAAHTYKIEDAAGLSAFCADMPPVDFIIESFVPGDIYTFDGLADRNGEAVFTSSLTYSQGIMETVNGDLDIYYYILRHIPEDIVRAGQATLAAFDVRERLFHFEFFRTPEGRILGLEVNMRPPGGLTTDMFNYAGDIDIYRGWAEVVMGRIFPFSSERDYYCAYFGRKDGRSYAHSLDDILGRYSAHIVQHQPISSIFAAAIGNYGIIARSPDLDELRAMAEYILRTA